MPAPIFRSLARRTLRRIVHVAAPRLDRLVARVYCSRLYPFVRWCMAGTERFEYQGAVVEIDTAEFMGYAAFFCGPGDNNEIDRLAALARGRTLFADVGANLGLISLPLAARLPGLEILAFEPDVRNRAGLARNLALNPHLGARVTVVRAAAGRENGQTRFLPDRENSGNGRVAATDAPGTYTVELVRLDDFCRRANRWPDVVKIDVEGAELAVLEGMQNLFATHPPAALFVEVHAFSAVDPARFKSDLRALLVAAGYRLHHPYGEATPHTPWDDPTVWPEHFSLLALHQPATA